MDHDHVIQLSGPFVLFDSLGRSWQIQAIRIVDESYAIIDVYIELVAAMEDEPLYADPLVIRQIMDRLRVLGYTGPDFTHADPGLQDEKLIVLEAPEAFGAFAARHGWKNLAAEYLESEEEPRHGSMTDADVHSVFCALMHKLRAKDA
jgi:hypothetical protein